MWEMWPAIVMGWPALGASVGCTFIGLAQGRPAWLVAAAVLVAPFTWYLSMAPAIGPGIWLLPAAQLGAALALRSRRRASSAST